MNTNDNTTQSTQNTTDNATDWDKLADTDWKAFCTKMDQFIQLRAQGLSLGKISQQIGVPKSTLYDWNVRNARVLESLRRAELEALEERIIGSQTEQLTVLFQTLKNLDQTFALKLKDYRDLSLSELFWMSSNLRYHIRDLRGQAALTDSLMPYCHPDVDLRRPPCRRVRTIENRPDGSG